MTSVKIHKAKTELSRLIALVEAGEEVVIMRGDTPVARLAPYARNTAQRKPGRLKGLIGLDERFFEPLPDDELGFWEG
jgi:antitoxin (DNA-binding transcriptional repressor) of toxin-antitoxin stability system